MSKMDDYRFREEQVEKLKLKVRLEFEVAIASERTSAKKLRERLMQLDDEETALVKKNLRSVLNDAVLKRELERIERERIEAQTALAMFENLDVSPEDAVWVCRRLPALTKLRLERLRSSHTNETAMVPVPFRASL